jgi:hypothetical protein
MASNEIGGERRELPTIALERLNGHIASHDVPGLRQSLGERRKDRSELHGAEPSDHRHRRLLRLCHDRPRRRARQPPDELPPPHG